VMQDGKLMLSLDDAIALALENTSIWRSPDITSTSLTPTSCAQGGNTTRGVASGLVQGTPGGGVGGFAQAHPERAPAEPQAAPAEQHWRQRTRAIDCRHRIADQFL